MSAVRARVWLSAVSARESGSLSAVSAGESGLLSAVSGVRVRETGYVSVVREGQRVWGWVSVSLHSRAVVSCRQRPKLFFQLGSVWSPSIYRESR